MSQFFKLHNIIFDMSLNIGINTTLTDLEPFSSGRIMKIIDPSGYGIVLPYLTNDISFVNLFIGSFTYKLNYDLFKKILYVVIGGFLSILFVTFLILFGILFLNESIQFLEKASREKLSWAKQFSEYLQANTNTK